MKLYPQKTGQRSRLLITVEESGTVVCSQGSLANTFLARLVGLLGQRELEPDSGLLIAPSSGVHTFGMSFSIDIVSLDKNHRVLGVFEHVGSGRIRGLGLKTRSVLELPTGQVRACGIKPGSHLNFESR